MSRAKTAADEAYNARRRLKRRAARLQKKADEIGGAYGKQMETASGKLLEKAASLYENERARNKFEKQVAKKYGLDVSRAKQARDKERKEQIKQSEIYLENIGDDEAIGMRREQEAKDILSTNIGSRIYAGLIDIWATETDNGKYKQNVDDINTAIMKHFGLSSMADVLEYIQEKIGEELFDEPDNNIKYDEVMTAIMLLV